MCIHPGQPPTKPIFFKELAVSDLLEEVNHTNARLEFYGENYKQVVADHGKFGDHPWKQKITVDNVVGYFFSSDAGNTRSITPE